MTAILIDGGFYRKRASAIWGAKSAKDRVDELMAYCHLHLADKDAKRARELYRIFYYDCPPIDKNIFNPVTRKTENLGKSETYLWTNSFFSELVRRRKVALRLGRLSDVSAGYRLRHDSFKELCAGKKKFEDVSIEDIQLDVVQKGVDVKLGIDIISLAYDKLVDQIILVSGDSDFVPAAKLARRKGIDFILDPMGSKIADDLLEHIDGLSSHWRDIKMPGLSSHT